MSDGSEKRPLTKMLWSVSIKTRTFASVNTCNGSFQSCLKLLKQYRTIEQMCSDAQSITLTRIYLSENNGHNNNFNPVLIIFRYIWITFIIITHCKCIFLLHKLSPGG